MGDSRDEDDMEWEARLLRSARLDLPPPGARDRVLGAVSKEPAQRRNRNPTIVAAVVASVAAAAVIAIRARRPHSIELRPESPAPAMIASAAPSAAAPVGPRPCPKLTIAPSTESLIDDFEDQNARLLLVDGRDGTWAVYSDGTAPKILPAVNYPWHPQRLSPPRGESRYGLHVVGGKMPSWGAVVTVDLADGACYDVSSYAGLEFWAKGNTRMHVSLTGIDSIPEARGGLCAGECSQGAAKPVDLNKTWVRYRVSWDELRQATHAVAEFDPARVVTLAFGFYSQDTPFDAWLDDIRFVEQH
jgi:hypothetical protein